MTNSDRLPTRSAASVAARATAQVAGESEAGSTASQSRPAVKTAAATATCAATDAALNATLIGGLRVMTACTTSMPVTAASSRSSVSRKNRPRTSGHWLNVRLWLSRPNGRWTAKRSLTTNSRASAGHHTCGSSSGSAAPRSHRSAPAAARPPLSSQISRSGRRRSRAVTRAVCCMLRCHATRHGRSDLFVLGRSDHQFQVAPKDLAGRTTFQVAPARRWLFHVAPAKSLFLFHVAPAESLDGEAGAGEQRRRDGEREGREQGDDGGGELAEGGTGAHSRCSSGECGSRQGCEAMIGDRVPRPCQARARFR